MIAADRERMLQALMGELGKAPPVICRELEQMFVEDLNRLEPIVDEIVKREVAAAGKHDGEA